MHRTALGPQAEDVYESLCMALRSGMLRPGQRLPSQRTLAAQLNVAPVTLRRALARLRDEGVLSLEQGRGTFVHRSYATPHASDKAGLPTVSPARETHADEVQLAAVVRIQAEIASAGLALQAVMDLVAERAQSLTRAMGAVIELAEGEEMVYRAVSGSARPSLGLRLARVGSLSGRCVQLNQALHCEDSESDERVDREACRRVGARSMVVVPLCHGQLVVGVLKVLSPRPHAFEQRDVHTLELLAGVIGAAMSHALAFEHSQNRLATETALSVRLAADVTESTAQLEAAHRERSALTISLQESEQRFRAAFDQAAAGIAYCRLDGSWLQVNDRLCAIYGRSRDELLRLDFRDITYPDDLEADLAQLDRLLDGEIESYALEKRFIRPDGSLVWTMLRVSMVRDAAGTPSFLVCIVEDINDRKDLEEQLRHQALHDGLTGLPNRTLLQDRLDLAIRSARRRGGAAALLLMDLDRFKDVNDTFGHHVGDSILQHLGARLTESLRGSDSIARLGGDEFAVLLPTADVQNAVQVASKVLRTLEQPITVDDRSFMVESSIGIAIYPEHGEDGDTLLRRADVAMYNAKRSRSGYALYVDDDDQDTAERLALIADLRGAIEGGQLMLHYQPKVNLRSGEVEGVEALVRWQHPDRGLIPPSTFIPLAEHTGAIKFLSEWVLAQSLMQCRRWHERGWKLRVAVNLSARNLHDPDLVPTVKNLLCSTGVAAKWLQLELTESVVMDEPFRASETLTRLRALGCRLSIDDFGTGHSSLAYLKRFPADEIKIDRSFVLEMASNESDRRIVRATIRLGHELGLQAVAEGVENQTAWDKLASFGCDMVQGYYLSPPMPADACTKWLEERRVPRDARGDVASA